MNDKHFGTTGLKLGDTICGPNDPAAVVNSGDGGTIAKVLQPRISLPAARKGELEPEIMNYSLSLATKRILGIAAYETSGS